MLQKLDWKFSKYGSKYQRDLNKVYGVVFSKLIADGDSSCYAKILEARPYANITVEKIECRNHLLRNYCNKLKIMSEQAKLAKPKLRKCLQSKILKLRGATTEAIKYRKKEEQADLDRISALKNDIFNGPNHVFGDHANCACYFCSGTKDSEINMVPEFKDCGLYDHIMKAVNYLANHSRSLIYDVDSNIVEQYHAIIAKFVGGKRINYCLRRSYQGRCAAAVVAHNTKKPHSHLHKSMCDNRSPNKYVKHLKLKRLANRNRAVFK